MTQHTQLWLAASLTVLCPGPRTAEADAQQQPEASASEPEDAEAVVEQEDRPGSIEEVAPYAWPCPADFAVTQTPWALTRRSCRRNMKALQAEMTSSAYFGMLPVRQARLLTAALHDIPLPVSCVLSMSVSAAGSPSGGRL